MNRVQWRTARRSAHALPVEGHMPMAERLGRTLDAVARGGLEPALADAGSAWVRVGHYGAVGEFAKGLLDRAMAAAALLLASPLLLAIAVAIRRDSPGPAFFRQIRIGRDGVPFTFWKFRGMVVDAKRRFPEMYDYAYSAEQVDHMRFHAWTDPRVTRVGRFIRRTGLDELPNLINVVRGDMSLVGPRPEIPELIPYFGASARIVLSVRPGVTSLALLAGRSDLTFSETLALDVRYVRERSFRNDMRILWASVALALGRLGLGR